MSSSKYSISEIESFCARLYGAQQLLIVPYGYNIAFTALNQGTNQQTTLNIAANADFVLLGLRHRANIGAAQLVTTVTAPYVRALLIDSGSNEQFTAQTVDLQNYSTNGQYELDLPYPRVIAGRSTLTVQVTNYAPIAENYTNLDIYLSGVLVRGLTT